ncbi:hypothetical protein N0V82_000252 [Gnomoniopsis sp. IMI 355080]|nr:hypothetical protein N0V82_000252 [Gnomoniopsis sp. IMI 355080]
MEAKFLTPGPARPSSLFWVFSHFLGRPTAILLVLYFALVLSTSSRGPSPTGREEVGRCFNFTSRALDHYQVLNLPRDVPHELIRPAYLTLARVCHPDKLKKEVSWETANENYGRLRLAYDVLEDESMRCTYECDVVFDMGRAEREWQRCYECSKLKYLRFVRGEDRRASEKDEHKTYAGTVVEEQKDMAGEAQGHQWGGDNDGNDDEEEEEQQPAHVQLGATSTTLLRTAVRETGLVLEKYALQVLIRARRCLVSLRGTIMAGRHASLYVGAYLTRAVYAVNRCATLWTEFLAVR